MFILQECVKIKPSVCFSMRFVNIWAPFKFTRHIYSKKFGDGNSINIKALIFKGRMNGGIFLKMMTISLVFFQLIFMWLLCDHCTISWVSFCKWESAGSETSSVTMESFIHVFVQKAPGLKVINHNEKSSGPSKEPCRTDPFTRSQADSYWSIRTWCLLSERKEPIQSTRISETVPLFY